jgi:hypothetical protein
VKKENDVGYIDAQECAGLVRAGTRQRKIRSSCKTGGEV